MNGTTQTGTLSLISAADTNWKMIGTADFSQDGQLDILWYYTGTGAYSGHIAYWYMNGNTFVTSIDLINATPSICQTDPATWELVGAGYIGGAGDKKPDLLWFNKVTGEMAVWHMDGSSYVSSAYVKDSSGVNVIVAWPWKYAATGDYNRDSHTEIFFRNTSSGADVLWLMNGTTYQGPINLPTSSDTNWEIVGADHFNNPTDSSIDLLWRNKVTGENAIWLMNGPAWASTATLPSRTDLNWKIGGTGDSKQDIDADGLSDLWERNNFGNLAQNGTGDPDADGWLNSQEYANATNPSLAELKVTISRPSGSSGLP